MSLTDRIKSLLTEERNEIKINVLQAVLGKVSTLESGCGNPLTDEEVTKLIRNIIQSNHQALGFLVITKDHGDSNDEANRHRLSQENMFLDEFLRTPSPPPQCASFG